jgi:hypothetical protein
MMHIANGIVFYILMTIIAILDKRTIGGMTVHAFSNYTPVSSVMSRFNNSNNMTVATVYSTFIVIKINAGYCVSTLVTTDAPSILLLV